MREILKREEMFLDKEMKIINRDYMRGRIIYNSKADCYGRIVGFYETQGNNKFHGKGKLLFKVIKLHNNQSTNWWIWNPRYNNFNVNTYILTNAEVERVFGKKGPKQLKF